MKNITLLVMSLLLSFVLAGCDGDKKTDCKKDPKAEGCPLYDGNIKRSEPKQWSFGEEEKKTSKEDK